VPPPTIADNAAKFSRRERSIQTIARRRANRQLMHVPWMRFHRAYDQYPRWQALLLWTQAIIATQGGVSPWLVEELRKHCMGLLEDDARKDRVADLGLLQWIHNQQFGCAKRQGWLDALTFYGVRHPRSECAWAYWERCDQEWSRKQPGTLPAFDQWWRQAQKTMPRGKINYRGTVEKYLDGEALALWLRPLLASEAKLPRHVISELKRRCPGILAAQSSGRRLNVENPKTWRSLAKWRKGHYLKEASEADSLPLLLQKVRSHPLHVRLVHYGKYWAREWSGSGVRFYPSFRAWRLAAERYVVD
jgi:hypothetical protein